MRFSVEDAVRKRISVRSYDKKSVEDPVRKAILDYAAGIRNPLGPDIRVQFLDKTETPGGEKLGTYGIIKGAGLYLGATMRDAPHAAEALGYAYEELVLYMTSLGLGTCWLGGTFNKSAFANAMDIREGEIFPIVSPVGYPAAKQSITERIMRAGIKADQRLSWNELFYREDFHTPLTEEEAGDYAFPLEMVRLAPSAVNKQPWRIVRKDGAFHFFQADFHAGSSDAVDMHRIDLGIAICHFHLAAQEKGLAGRLERLDKMEFGAAGNEAPDKPASAPLCIPESMVYITSWIPA